MLHNLCPGGQDNKCCRGWPVQEPECAAAGGACVDSCGCGGAVLHGLCPSQPGSIKCCPAQANTTDTGDQCGLDTEAGAAGSGDDGNEPGGSADADSNSGSDGAGDCSRITCKRGEMIIYINITRYNRSLHARTVHLLQ